MIRGLALLAGSIGACFGFLFMLYFLWGAMFAKGPDAVIFVGAMKLLLISGGLLGYWAFSRPRATGW